MIKRTLCFSNPAYLSTKSEQLVIQLVGDQKAEMTVPIEDIGVIVLEHPQLTLTNKLLEKLIQQQVALIGCDGQHLPISMMMPLCGHSEQTERIRAQIEASQPLKKNLWQQTVMAKIQNQGTLLQTVGLNEKPMKFWIRQVNSGDTHNHEGRAAAHYWQELSSILSQKEEVFTRQSKGVPPNHLLNYGYAILRGVTARALVSSGLLPTLGIFHHNKYNAYCLADDIMEPYRPFVDKLVVAARKSGREFDQTLHTEDKKLMLSIPALDVIIDGKKSPLLVAMSRTTHSLYECFAGKARKILYPEYV